MDDFWFGVMLGVSITLVIMVFVVIGPAANVVSVEAEGHEVLEDYGTRVLMDDAIDVGEAVHFATADGYFIYYDGILYQEVK